MMSENKAASEPLKGWAQIAEFLGQTVSVAQRWAKSGMPVSREGRGIRASRDDLNRWLERESAEPVQIATNTNDLGPELKRGLSYVRKQHAVAKASTAKVEDRQ
jgi:phage terminase Nu1 subunit (DNA packaging protein)